jgi:hypothetical protein
LFSCPEVDILRPLGSYIGSRVEVGDERSEQEFEIPDAPGDITVFNEPAGMEIEDFLNDEEDSSSKLDPYLTIDGEKYHKSSVVTARLTSKGARKATMRTLRVRGVTLDNLRESDHTALNSENLTQDDMIKKQDIVAALIRAEDDICLAVVEVLGFEEVGSKARSTEVKMDDLEGSDKPITVFGQILELRPTANPEALKWLWTGHYIRFGETSQSPSTNRQYVLRIPGKLVYPLGPTVVPTPREWIDTDSGKTATQTWSLTDLELAEILEFAWDSLNPDSEEIISNVELLPVVSKSSMPYCSQLGMHLLLLNSLISLI